MGRELGLGPPRLEQAKASSDGKAFVHSLIPGEWVSLRWDWVCDRLATSQLGALRRYTRRDLDIANRSQSAPSVA